MVGFYSGEPVGYAGLVEQGSDAVPATAGQATAAAFSEGLALNPTGRLIRQVGRTASETGGVFGDPFGGGVAFLEPETEPLDPEAANAEYGIPGVLKFDKPVTRTIARDLNEAKRAKIEREDVLARRESEAARLEVGTQFLASVAASALDPINVAAAFIPIVGPARAAAWLAQAGSALGRAGIRAEIGAAAGAVGTAALQPLEFALSRAEMEDYTMATALRSIALVRTRVMQWKPVPAISIAHRPRSARRCSAVPLRTACATVRGFRAPAAFQRLCGSTYPKADDEEDHDQHQ